MRFCQACENNKDPIIEQLVRHFANCKRILEIGSGTGQHAVYFAPRLPHLRWQTSDLAENHDSILAWMEDYPSSNIQAPVHFEIGVERWLSDSIDGVFTANTAHIMQPELTRQMMELVSSNLVSGNVFCQYGPFNVDGEYTSEGNRQFDRHLKAEGCGGIRDIAELEAWVENMVLVERIAMPANNFLLVWKK